MDLLWFFTYTSTQHALALIWHQVKQSLKQSSGGLLSCKGVYPNVSTHCKRDLAALYRMHEGVKKQEYGERVREFEWGVFTSLVLLTTGGLARESTIFFKRLADATAEKRKLHCSQVMGWLHGRISFALIKSANRAIKDFIFQRVLINFKLMVATPLLPLLRARWILNYFATTWLL